MYIYICIYTYIYIYMYKCVALQCAMYLTKKKREIVASGLA